jgi:tRNA(fMet)-specific endonuclease VapC
MAYVVLDTDVCSFLFRRDERAERYRPHLLGQTLCLSFQTVAELYQGAEMAGWGEDRRARLEEWLQAFVILPYDNETARAWARIRAERKHTPIAPQDAWVAACAIRHKCPLVTHNASDYADINGLVILTEREA